jgi:hypothetical protein
MAKSVVNQLVEITLDEAELIAILRAQLSPEQKAKLLDPDDTKYKKLTLIHQEGKPYVFMWRESEVEK